MEYLASIRRGEVAADAASFLQFLSNVQAATRQFAKRQLTWFRNDDIYSWLDSALGPDELVSLATQGYLLDDEGEWQWWRVQHGEGDIATPDKQGKAALKAYIAKNTLYVDANSCSSMVRWIRETQSRVIGEA
eukprot:scaffold1393_cov343-Prasinococcus_capsulatus_cf.AAC.9